MIILITEIEKGWQTLYSINGNSCIHQFKNMDGVIADLKQSHQIECDLLKCPNPAPDRLLRN